jgi:hypothetical protein
MSSFLRVTLRRVALLMVSASFVAGCGGSGKATTAVIEQQPGGQNVIANYDAQRARGLDSEAKSDARNMVVQLEVCATDHAGSYAHCANLGNTGLPIGPGPGQVETTTADVTYTVTAHSRSGNTFQLIKDASGTTRRTCQVRSDAGGCLGGTW